MTRPPPGAKNRLPSPFFIRSRKRPLADVEIGARSVAITILGNLAYWNRRVLHWDPVKWEFVGDSLANTWLDRERRDPWQLPAA